MSKTLRRSLSAFLVCLQIVLLLGFAAPTARAAAMPVRNPVLERTARFGSFGFNGDPATGRDGIDYVTTYYYSDDYFAPSACNPNATKKVMDFSDLEDLSMATLSKAFVLSICSSDEGNVPVDWSHKSKNGERFFSDCGFENVFVCDEFNRQTERDSLGYMFASKPITVWDARTQSNRAFTLVAVGIRGGGYGAEWASNLTISDSDGAAGSDPATAGTYRHKGFQDSTDKVLRDLDVYLAAHHITGDVKYWVGGYSRSGAVANLAAGTLTDEAAKYHTTRDDVYCYTYECAAGALASEDPDGTRYPNIHNILNAMDLVPRISPAQFGHGRLGVDYRMPFYANTAPEENAAYYARMRAVLPVVAEIADIYNAELTGIEGDKTADAVITDSDPAVYPYDRPVQIKSFKLANLFSGGLTKDVSNADSVIAPAEGLMYDQFLDAFVDHFIRSRAWDAAYLKRAGLGWSSEDMTFDPLSHEFQYVRVYQRGMRSITGAFFKTPGRGFNNLGGALSGAAKAIDAEAIWNASGLAAHYGLLHLDTRYNYHVHEMIDPAVSLVNKIIDASDLFAPEDLEEIHAAVRIVMPAIIWLYCEDHVRNNGEYLGTLMDNFSTIFVTHIPEMTISWLMSLDEVFTCDYREITVPKETRVTVREFREQYGETLSAEGDAPVIAEAENGVMTRCIDDRVTLTTGRVNDPLGGPVDTVTIRYPGNLDLRFDVTPIAGVSFGHTYLRLNDLSPIEVVNVRSVCQRDDKGHIVSDSIRPLVVPSITSGAKAVNDSVSGTALPLAEGQTLRVLAQHGSNQIAHPDDGSYTLVLEKLTWRDPVPVIRARLEELFAGLGAW